jgi:hypothetical protein
VISLMSSIFEKTNIAIKYYNYQEPSMVQITIVSINGSSKATKPSDAEYFVLTAECAMDAEPAPASLEKAALLNPMTRTPIKPPKAGLRVKRLLEYLTEKAVPTK